MIKFYPSVLNGQIEAPPSRAHALRILFAAAMCATPTKIENLPDCSEIMIAANCLRALGCKIEFFGDKRLSAKVEPFPKTTSLKVVDFNFKDSATTARFMTAIASALGFPANCRAEGTLAHRSQVSMTSRMALRGAVFSSFSFPLKLEGRLTGGLYELRGSEDSQFISALLLVLPILKDDSYIKFTEPLVDRTFIDMTIDIINRFGVHIEEREDGFFIPGRQYYQSAQKVVCDNDWAIASMWISAAAACSKSGGRVEVTGLPQNAGQMYKDVQYVLPLISQDFTDLNIDASNFPNLATVFCSLAVARGGIMRITGAHQLKRKETNRLKTMGTCLASLGISYEATNDGMIVSGKEGASYPENLVIDTQNDPWIFMSMALASVALKQPIILKDEHGAEKIYKQFLADFTALGGKYEIY